MPERCVIYGEAVDKSQRAHLLNGRGAEAVAWSDDAEPFAPSEDSTTVFVDLDDPRFCRSDFLISLATAGEGVRIVGVSKDPSVDTALKVAKLGVSQMITPDECVDRIDKLLAELEGQANQPGPDKESSFDSSQALIGVSPQIDSIRQTIAVLSDVDFPSALILGETGTGKSLICRILHNAGVRSKHNLVEVNCSAIPDELFESELFGHTRGAFTDAKSDKAGLFEYAEGGTLFLDEIGNLSNSAQAKLLKILEDKKLRPVGSVVDKDIDTRVVAATNLHLEEAIRDGGFREDLFFRLNLLTIEIPPLRERPEDIPDLAEYYLGYYSTNYGKPGIEISRQTMSRLCSYDWPGNVRQLCNVIERAVLLNRSGRIGVDDIGVVLKDSRLTAVERQQLVIELPPQGITLAEIEVQVVKQVLNACDWNKTETARFLGISRPRLRRIIDNAGLERDRRTV